MYHLLTSLWSIRAPWLLALINYNISTKDFIYSKRQQQAWSCRCSSSLFTDVKTGWCRRGVICIHIGWIRQCSQADGIQQQQQQHAIKSLLPIATSNFKNFIPLSSAMLTKSYAQTYMAPSQLALLAAQGPSKSASNQQLFPSFRRAVAKEQPIILYSLTSKFPRSARHVCREVFIGCKLASSDFAALYRWPSKNHHW